MAVRLHMLRDITILWSPDGGHYSVRSSTYCHSRHYPLVHIVRVKASDLQGGASAHTYKHSSSDDLCDVNPVLYDDAIVVLHRRRAPGAEDGSGVSHHCCGADRGTGRHYIYGERTRLKCIKYRKFSLNDIIPRENSVR